ncbi:MAG TPA: DNA polymerase IV [Rectinemataceae bacterium]|nr:DNA polymerase IV [Rectinemataceae bacterium]
MSRVIFHIDIDAFFASVEQLDDPSLVGRPVIVGASPGHRGVVSTCSYEARAFGVHSAMPISEAFRRCPEGVFLPVRMERYAELSARVMEAFGEFTPDLRRVSVDEAFLDMTGTQRLWGPSEAAARLIKARVRAATGLSISIGVAPNPYVAKIASGLRKPDGLVIVEEGEEEAFMLGLPLTKLWGAGEKTQERFRELGIVSVAQLASLGQAQISSLFGRAGGQFLYGAARGRDPGIMGGEPESRSMSAETTFERDIADRESIEAVLMGLADELAYRLWSEGMRSRTLALKLRLHDFTTLSRRLTRKGYYLAAEDAFRDALALLGKAWDGRSEIRLIGLGFAELERDEGQVQGELFADGNERRRRAETAVFEIERKGLGKVTRARLMGRERRGPSGAPGEKP